VEKGREVERGLSIVEHPDNSTITGGQANATSSINVLESTDVNGQVMKREDSAASNGVAAAPDTVTEEEDKLSNIEEEEVSKRNFYLTLFQIYSELPFQESLNSFSKIYNDVFVLERPVNCQKYFLTEVQVLELNEICGEAEELSSPRSIGSESKLVMPFRFNFTQGTSREVDYSASTEFLNFITKAVK